MKIGFGSCLNQDKAMPIFDAIKNEKLDLFLNDWGQCLWRQ